MVGQQPASQQLLTQQLLVQEILVQQPSNRQRWVSPQRVDIGISVLDCSSRLESTARARVYDKIRRHLSTLPTRIREFYSDGGMATPRIQLNLYGLSDALSGLPASTVLAVCETAEKAAVDEGADLVRLMETDIAGGSKSAHDISMIPELLASCTRSEISLQLASSIQGGNARDLYATALLLLLGQFPAESSSRLILSCNSTLGLPRSPVSLDEVTIESVYSIWPMMSAMRDELATDACYTDTAIALSFIGTKMTESGRSLQSELVSQLRNSGLSISGNTVKLSIDAPGEGPVPAGIWCGLPLSAYAGAASSRAAAQLLKERLSSAPSASRRPVESDSLPISDSIRNIHAVSADTDPADLAGSLVRVLTQPVALAGQKYFKVASVDAQSSPQGVSMDHVDGTVPYLPVESGWSSDHFSNGGLILTPSR